LLLGSQHFFGVNLLHQLLQFIRIEDSFGEGG
jgi:hypothetical protein